MNELEIKTALDGIKEQVTTSSSQNKEEVKGLIDALEAKMAKNESIEEIKAELKSVQDHANLLDVKLQERKSEPKNNGFDAVFANELKNNFDTIKTVQKGRSANIELKAVGVMTATANLTGDSVMTYQAGVAVVPSQKVNVSDLVPTVNSTTGNYVIYRETGSEGSISEQGTPGAAKSQIDYDLTNVTFVANYISGYVRYAKQMAQDLPFLTSFLPNALRRDYYKAENSIFSTALLAAATASTSVATVNVEQLIESIGQLESTDYSATGIVVNPSDWAQIAITKPSDYSLPGVVTYTNGQLAINGVPIYKATWIAQGTFIVADWSYAKKVVVDGLSVEFFEQDQDNVIKNVITARVESRTVLGIDMPGAFIKGTFAESI